MRKAAVLVLSSAMALAACNRGTEEKLPEDNVVEVDNAAAAANVTTILPAANTTNATAKPAPAPRLTDQQQMHDDADASGMTSRLPDETPATGNETLPAK